MSMSKENRRKGQDAMVELDLQSSTRVLGRQRLPIERISLRELPKNPSKGEILVVAFEGRQFVGYKLHQDPSRIRQLTAHNLSRRIIRRPSQRRRTPPHHYSLALLHELKSTLRQILSTSTDRPLTEREQQNLTRGGFDLKAPKHDGQDPVEVAKQEYEGLLKTSLDTSEAAKLLKVNSSRIRQRLVAPEPTLYGIKYGNGWRIPQFQFTESGLVPGIEEAIPHIGSAAHPVAVFRWFNTPNLELEIEDDRLLTPIDWLRTGRSPSVVAELAKLTFSTNP